MMGPELLIPTLCSKIYLGWCQYKWSKLRWHVRSITWQLRQTLNDRDEVWWWTNNCHSLSPCCHFEDFRIWSEILCLSVTSVGRSLRIMRLKICSQSRQKREKDDNVRLIWTGDTERSEATFSPRVATTAATGPSSTSSCKVGHKSKSRLADWRAKVAKQPFLLCSVHSAQRPQTRLDS